MYLIYGTYDQIVNVRALHSMLPFIEHDRYRGRKQRRWRGRRNISPQGTKASPFRVGAISSDECLDSSEDLGGLREEATPAYNRDRPEDGPLPYFRNTFSFMV